MEKEKDLKSNKIEVVRLIEFLQDEIEAAQKVPFSNRVMVDQKLLTQLIDDIIQNLPEDFSTAQYVISQKDKILDEANAEYNRLKHEAQELVKSKVNDHSIMAEARAESEAIISKANAYYEEIKRRSNEYIVEQLEQLQISITKSSDLAMEGLKKNMESFVHGIDKSVNSIVEKVEEDMNTMSPDRNRNINEQQ